MLRAFGDRAEDIGYERPKEHVLQDSEQHEDQHTAHLQPWPALADAAD
jgi:hypothetical protein